MKTLLLITAQYHENYGANSWKPKGSQTFTLRVDSDMFCYAKDECIKAIQSLLDRQSNEHERFTYVEHELIFHEPIVLNDAEFESELTHQCEELGRVQR